MALSVSRRSKDAISIIGPTCTFVESEMAVWGVLNSDGSQNPNFGYCDETVDGGAFVSVDKVNCECLNYPCIFHGTCERG